MRINGDCLIRARSFVSLADETPAVGARSREPIRALDNAHILIKNGRVEKISPRPIPFAGERIDIDKGYLVPPLVNAHAHTQLSWLKGRLTRGRGFAAWLASLIPQLMRIRDVNVAAEPAADDFPQLWRRALTAALDGMELSGVKFFGDVGGTLPGALGIIERETKRRSLRARHFCEWFGWEASERPWPARSLPEAARIPDAAPCGHALYSTSPDTLRAVKAWTRSRGLPFSLHLAESAEEDEALLTGAGPLYDLYRDKVLPPDWRPPKARAIEYAESLGLLGPGTLAVHGSRLAEADLKRLAGAALCLCPRSNAWINVGSAPLAALLESDVLLCLGTDGLTSNEDLDPRKEAAWLREKYDYPVSALIRMLTINGAAALGFPPVAIREGDPAEFAVLDNLD